MHCVSSNFKIFHTGGVGVGGSNPLVPTNFPEKQRSVWTILPVAESVNPTFTCPVYATAMENPKSNARLNELDALRGIAACMVMVFHYTWQLATYMPHVEPPGSGFWAGIYGLHLFFGISGFVIFMTLDKTRRATDFLVSRFARLFPAYWAGIVVTTLTVHALDEPMLQEPAGVVLANLTMIQRYFDLRSVDGVYWSLSIELGFYACMLALWYLKRLNSIEVILLGWIALKILWWEMPGLPFLPSLLLAVEYIPYFAIGIVSYRVWKGERRWVQQVPVLAMGLIATLIADPLGPAVAYCLITVIFWAIAEGKLKWLITGPLVWLGSISYPLYLVHQYIGWSVIDHAQRLGLNVWAAIAIAIAVSLALANLIHLFVEVPGARIIRSKWKPRAIGQDALAPNFALQKVSAKD
jgi:peptidoglycan/LPS O-acetylase OafA/YrhL